MKKIIVKESTNEVIDSSIKEENKIKKDEKQKFFDIKFENNLKNKKIFSLTKDKHQVDLSFLGRKGKELSNAQGVENGNHVKYTNFEKGLDLSYDYQDNLVKESVIINERKDNYDFSFSLNIGELKPIYNSETRTLELKSNGNTIYRILSPFMVDKNNVRSDDCSYEIEQKNSNLMINLHCDSDWINDESRVFPVVVDPTIEVVENVINIIHYKNGSVANDKKLKIGLDTEGPDDLRININCNIIKNNINNLRRVILSLPVKSSNRNALSKNKDYQLVTESNQICLIQQSSIGNKLCFDLTELVTKSSGSIILFLGPVLRNAIVKSGSTLFYYFNVEFYPLYSENETCKSELIIEYDEKNTFETTKSYKVGNTNELVIDVRDGSFKNINDLGFKLKSNGIGLNLCAIYDKNLSKDFYMSSGWKTNLHQTLEKSTSFNNVLGSTEIIYTDGNNKKHNLITKWYYINDNQKHYVEKKNIYLDSDGKLKVIKDGSIYEIKSETTNEEGITYASGNDISNFNQLKDSTKYHYEIKCGVGTISDIQIINYTRIKIPKYVEQIDSIGIEDDIRFENIDLINGKSLISGNNVTLKGTQEVALKADGDGLYFKYQVYIDDEVCIEEQRVDIKPDLDNYDANDDIYLNEDILNINSQIKSIENSKRQAYLSLNSAITSIRNLDEQITYQWRLIARTGTKEYDAEFKRLYEDNSIGMKALKNSITNNVTLNQVFELDGNGKLKIKKDKESSVDKSENAETVLNIISNYLTLLGNKITLLNKTIEKDYSGDYESFQLKLLNRQYNDAKEQMELMINSCFEYDKQLDYLKGQKNQLVNIQKKEVNDFIIDKDGNTLGFDGYGHLILIQDRYENKINIEYDYDDIETGRLSRVISDMNTLEYHYNKVTKLLDYIGDSRGVNTKFVYIGDEELQLSSIAGAKETTTFSYGNTFIIKTLLNSLKLIHNDDDTVSVKEYYLNTKIGENITFDSSADEINTTDDLYIFDTTSYLKTIIRDKKTNNSNDLNETKEDEVYCFSSSGKCVKNITDEFVNVSYYNLDLLKQEATYRNNDEVIIKPLTIDGESHEYSFDLTSNNNELLNKIKQADLIGFKLVLNTGNVDNIGILDLALRVDVTTSTNKVETFSESFQELKLQEVVLPIFVNTSNIKKLVINVTSKSSDFNDSYIDVLDLIALENGATYKYDNKDRLIYKQDKEAKITYSDFDAHDNPLQSVSVDKYDATVTTKYAYDVENRLTYVEDSLGNVNEYYYDDNGQCIKKRSYNKEDASLVRQETYEYDDKGRIKDKKGPIKNKNKDYPLEHIEYLPHSEVTSKVIGYNKLATNYIYDYLTNDLLSISASADGISNSNSFGYTKGFLTSVSSRGVKVKYVYDGRGRIESIYLNGDSVAFISNTYVDGYNSNTSNLENDLNIKYGTYRQSTYKNGLEESIFTNSKGQILRVETEETDRTIRIDNTYDSNGNITNTQSTITEGDVVTTEDVTYTYDSHKKLTKMVKKIDDESIYEIEYEYNDKNLVIGEVLKLDGEHGDGCYEYDSKRRPTFVAPDDFSCYITYDSLDRIIHKEVEECNFTICHTYSYLKEEDNSLDLIASDIVKVKVVNGDNTTYQIETNRYSYDEMGNIIEIDCDESKTRYKYDALNRLEREDNPSLNKTIVYKYDEAGNVILKKTYSYTLDDKLEETPVIDEYVYSCSNWGDQLIDYNGKTFKYDNMGRTLVYKGDTCTWSQRGELKSVKKDNQEAFKYYYDANGIRNKKIVNGVETKFVVVGTKILKSIIKVGNEERTIKYKYVLDKLEGFVYTKDGISKEYRYERNIFGDITRIYNSEGSIEATYVYDAYGRVKVINSIGEEDTNIEFIGNINPFRYRGYYFDIETGLYYLNSRYYDPELGRFISPDTMEYLSPNSINGLNLYCYCNNNPISYSDPSGNLPQWAMWLIGVVVIAGLAIATVATGGAAGVILGAAFYGAVTSAVGGALVGGIIGGITGGWEGILDGAASGFMWGAISGAVAGALISGINIASGSVQIVGSAQKTGSLFHQFASNVQAGKMSLAVARYSEIHLNRSKGLDIKGFRPDVTGITKNGLRVVEVVSSSQTYASQVAKVGRMIGQYSHISNGLTLDALRFITKWFVF